MQPLAVIAAILIVSLAAAAGFFAARLFHKYQDLKQRLQSMDGQINELNEKLADAQYPRRRTHADTARLEDLQAFADHLRDEIELTGLHLDQEHRQHAERMRQLSAIAGSIFEYLGETRSSKPTDHPDDRLQKPFREHTNL